MAHSKTYDFVIVGSGVNSLVCAAQLALAGHKIALIERSDRLGGCIRTDELTLPGFRHDTLSGFHPLFVTSPAYAALGAQLHERGLEYANCRYPTGVILEDGRSLVMEADRQANIDRFNALAPGDGDSYRDAVEFVEQNAELTFALLGRALWRFSTIQLMAKELLKRGPMGLSNYFAAAAGSCRSWLEEDFQSDLVRGLFAPWVLHTGLGPEAALSGFMGKVIAFTLEQAGMPIVKNGSDRFVRAFRQLIEDNGGEIFLDTHIDEIEVADQAAQAVMSQGGDVFRADRGVICNVAPTQLYLQLLRNAPLDAALTDKVRKYRYGRGDMQIHLALSEQPNWPDPVLKQVAMLHVTPGIDGVSRAVNAAECGLLPGEATIVVAQPTALDSSRAPAGKHILWLQLQELPRRIAGDAAGEIAIGDDGAWTPAIRDAYADRIIRRLTRLAPNLEGAILGRKALSPADIEKLNMNLVGGDPYCGVCSLEQFMMWRPFAGARNHATPIRKLSHIGASTHPGPGLGGVSGFLAAEALKKSAKFPWR